MNVQVALHIVAVSETNDLDDVTVKTKENIYATTAVVTKRFPFVITKVYNTE